MWSIVTAQVTRDTSTMTIRLDIEHELFESYLVERSRLYPSYINFNTYFYKILNPFQPFVCPFPYKGASRILVRESMKIGFPPKCPSFYRERYQQALVKCLFEWLEEEFKKFQKEWLENAN